MIGEKPSYPRFRGRNRYDSFTYPQFGFSLTPGKLHLSKIGGIKIKIHRAIELTIKTCTIRWMPTGKWFACFSIETDVLLLSRRDGPVLGVDVGLKSFATLSNGEKIDNPRFFRSEENDLARVQMKLSNASKCSPERTKALKTVGRVHERIANPRSNFINKGSRGLVDRFGVVASEDLNIKSMLQNGSLAKSISDVA